MPVFHCNYRHGEILVDIQADNREDARKKLKCAQVTADAIWVEFWNLHPDMWDIVQSENEKKCLP